MMSALILILCAIIAQSNALSTNHAQSEAVILSVSYDATGKLKAHSGLREDTLANGKYYLNYNLSGWNYLDVFVTPPSSSFDDQLAGAHAQGYIEGYLTCKDIKTFWPNFYSGMFGTDAPGNATIAFLQENFAWTKENAFKNSPNDEYWRAAYTTTAQIEGLLEGFIAGCPKSSDAQKDSNPYLTLDSPTLEHFLILNAWGDLYQITQKLVEPGMFSRLRGSRRPVTLQTVGSEEYKRIERCSAIIKLLPDFSDVVYGHTTWDSYESLAPRIIKHYSFPLANSKPYDVYFSSSPGLLTSVDDFYTVSGTTELGVMETSNDLFNPELIAKINPQTMLSWTRIVISNQIAKSGYNWAEVFSLYHSGTYVNQWMILDLPLFSAGVSPKLGFLTVFEEVPGLAHYEDQTKFLNANTYWPSFNNPYYEDIFNAAGYDKLCSKDKDMCHDTAPRALLFAEYQDDVKDIAGAEWILQYNFWQHDAASENDAAKAIACRGDLVKGASNGAYGALDSKVASVSTSRKSASTKDVAYPQIRARLGPTYDLQPVFCWSKFKDEASYSHNGHPDCFNFKWTVFPPIA